MPAIRFLQTREGVIGFCFVYTQRATPAFDTVVSHSLADSYAPATAKGCEGSFLPREAVVQSAFLLNALRRVIHAS